MGMRRVSTGETCRGLTTKYDCYDERICASMGMWIRKVWMLQLMDILRVNLYGKHRNYGLSLLFGGGIFGIGANLVKWRSLYNSRYCR